MKKEAPEKFPKGDKQLMLALIYKRLHSQDLCYTFRPNNYKQRSMGHVCAQNLNQSTRNATFLDTKPKKTKDILQESNRKPITILLNFRVHQNALSGQPNTTSQLHLPPFRDKQIAWIKFLC